MVIVLWGGYRPEADVVNVFVVGEQDVAGPSSAMGGSA